MQRILIADDHAIVRMGIKQLLKEAFPFALLEEVDNSEDLLKKVIRERWDIVISDISMPGRSGLEVLLEIRKSYPKLPVLMLSMYSEDDYGVRVIRAGASGYLKKDRAAEELVPAVRRILAGRKYITPSMAEKLSTVFDKNPEKALHESLSNREFEIFKLIADGVSVSEVAEKLSLSVTTVSTYRAKIMEKMGLKSNTDLTKYALENKLL